MLTSNDVPTLDEYCWHHKGPENGGWGCVQCYVEQNLARFFEAVAHWVQVNELPITLGHEDDQAIPEDWGIYLERNGKYEAYKIGYGCRYFIQGDDNNVKQFNTFEDALVAAQAASRIDEYTGEAI
jgi:hypothetical protein